MVRADGSRKLNLWRAVMMMILMMMMMMTQYAVKNKNLRFHPVPQTPNARCPEWPLPCDQNSKISGSESRINLRTYLAILVLLNYVQICTIGREGHP